MKDVWLHSGVLVAGGTRDAAPELAQKIAVVGRQVGVPGRQIAPLPTVAARVVAGQPRGTGGTAVDHPGVGGFVVSGVGTRHDREDAIAVDGEVLVLRQGVGGTGCHSDSRTDMHGKKRDSR